MVHFAPFTLTLSLLQPNGVSASTLKQCFSHLRSTAAAPAVVVVVGAAHVVFDAVVVDAAGVVVVAVAVKPVDALF